MNKYEEKKGIKRSLPFGFGIGGSNRKVINGHKMVDKAEVNTKALAINNNFMANSVIESQVDLIILFDKCRDDGIGNNLTSVFDGDKVMRGAHITSHLFMRTKNRPKRGFNGRLFEQKGKKSVISSGQSV